MMPKQQHHQRQVQETPMAPASNDDSDLMPRPAKMRFMGMGMSHMQMLLGGNTSTSISGTGGVSVGAGVGQGAGVSGIGAGVGVGSGVSLGGGVSLGAGVSGIGAGVSGVISVGVPCVRGVEVSGINVIDVTSHLPGSSGSNTLSYQPSLDMQQQHQRHQQQQHQQHHHQQHQEQQLSQQHMPVDMATLSQMDVPGTSGSLLKELEGTNWQTHWQFTNQWHSKRRINSFCDLELKLRSQMFVRISLFFHGLKIVRTAFVAVRNVICDLGFRLIIRDYKYVICI